MFKYMIYKTTNLLNNRYYIGFHKFSINKPEDGYLGSGKLIRRAVEKYGKENFKREVLFVFDTKEEAEQKEAEIVNKEFTLLEETYNVSIGGNVLIMFGKNNPFYGKKHSNELIKTMRENARKTCFERGYYMITKYHCFIDEKMFYDARSICSYLNIPYLCIPKLLEEVIGNNRGFFIEEDCHIEFESLREKILRHKLIMKESLSKRASERFKGVPKTQDHKDKIGASHKGKKHHWQNKINKNIEKIEKTRLKHIGAKRSEEARKNISDALLFYTSKEDYVNPIRNKKCFYNPNDISEMGFFNDDESPLSWVRGNPATKKKCFYNTETLECKRFNEGEQPSGWLPGNPNIKRKIK